MAVAAVGPALLGLPVPALALQDALSADMRRRFAEFLSLEVILVLLGVGAFWIWRAWRDWKRGHTDDIEYYGDG